MTTVEAWMLGAAIVGALAAAGAMIVSVVALNRQQSVKVQQPLEVKPSADYVHKNEFLNFSQHNEEVHRDLFSKIGGVERGTVAKVDVIRQEIHGMELRINESGEERSVKIHDRINEVLAEVSEIRGEIKNKL